MNLKKIILFLLITVTAYNESLVGKKKLLSTELTQSIKIEKCLAKLDKIQKRVSLYLPTSQTKNLLLQNIAELRLKLKKLKLINPFTGLCAEKIKNLVKNELKIIINQINQLEQTTKRLLEYCYQQNASRLNLNFLTQTPFKPATKTIKLEDVANFNITKEAAKLLGATIVAKTGESVYNKITEEKPPSSPWANAEEQKKHWYYLKLDKQPTQPELEEEAKYWYKIHCEILTVNKESIKLFAQSLNLKNLETSKKHAVLKKTLELCEKISELKQRSAIKTNLQKNKINDFTTINSNKQKIINNLENDNTFIKKAFTSGQKLEAQSSQLEQDVINLKTQIEALESQALC